MHRMLRFSLKPWTAIERPALSSWKAAGLQQRVQRHHQHAPTAPTSASSGSPTHSVSDRGDSGSETRAMPNAARGGLRQCDVAPREPGPTTTRIATAACRQAPGRA